MVTHTAKASQKASLEEESSGWSMWDRSYPELNQCYCTYSFALSGAWSCFILQNLGILGAVNHVQALIYHRSLIPRANEKTFWKWGSIIVVSPMQLVFPYLSIEVDTYSSFTSYPHKTVNGQIMSDAFRDNTEIPKNEKFFAQVTGKWCIYSHYQELCWEYWIWFRVNNFIHSKE